jgi:hypothetical protein
MTMINTLIKVSVAMLLIGGVLSTAQAGSQITIGANIASKIVVDVTTGASQSWTLDPQAGIYQATVADAVTVKCNKASWTLQATATNPKLTDGSHTLAGNFYVDATGATPATGYNWTSSATAGDLWIVTSGGKGIKSASLKFTQPVAWVDDISSGYGTSVTLTAAVA